MGAGAIMLDGDGKRILCDSGKRTLSDGDGNTCICGCGNDTGCAAGSPTRLVGCTGFEVSSNRLTATLTASASGTITAQGYLRGEDMDGIPLLWEYVDIEFTISWSASVDVDLRRIVNDGSYGVATPSTGSGGPGSVSFYASNASGSVTWSITDWGVNGAPPDWTEVSADDPAATGGIAASGSGDSLDVGGKVGVGVRKRFSFTDGITATLYYVTITCGGSGPILQDLSATGLGASICDGDSIAVGDSNSSAVISYGSGDFDDESATYDHTSQSVSISGTFQRELATDRSGDAECGFCDRAFDLTFVLVQNSLEDDVVITRTMTGRFVQQCPETRCLPNQCLWICATLTRVTSTVTGGGSPVVTSATQSSVYLNLYSRDADGRGLYFADFAFAVPFWAGECPSESPEPLYPTDTSLNVDGSTAGTTTRTITIEPSEPVEGDPECYCVPVMMRGAARAAPIGYQPAEEDSDVVICEDKIARDWTDEGQAILRAGITMYQGTKAVIGAAAWNAALAYLRSASA